MCSVSASAAPPGYGALDAAVKAIRAVHPTISRWDSEARAITFLADSAEARALASIAARFLYPVIESVNDVDALSEDARALLLREYFLLLGSRNEAGLALQQALVRGAPDRQALDDPEVARVFAAARARVRRAFQNAELRAAGILAIGMAAQKSSAA